MRRTHEATARQPLATAAEAANTVRGGAAYMAAVERRLAPYFARAEPRRRARAYLRGLLSPAERKNSWQLAEISGEATPQGVQHLLRRALWNPEAVRDELRPQVMEHLGDTNAVRVIDETGFLKQGHHSAGVARQDSGTAGRLDHCQLGVLVAYASCHGQALLDRELSLPTARTDDPKRCRQAGIPEGRGFATQPQLAHAMLQRVLAAGVPARWGAGDSGYGDDRRLRMRLEAHPQAYVWAVSGKEYVWLDWHPRQVKTVLAAVPEGGGSRLSAGNGTKGPRWGDWRWLALAAPLEPGWGRWLLVRRRLSNPRELQAYVVFAPQATLLDAVVRVAGARWASESSFEAGQSEVGLEHYEVRSWTGWYRHITVAMWALALLTVLRAGATAVAALKKRPAPAPAPEQPGGLQSRPWTPIPPSVPEIRRLVWRLALVVQQTAQQILAWSHWRRWQQAVAPYYHDKRRETGAAVSSA